MLIALPRMADWLSASESHAKNSRITKSHDTGQRTWHKAERTAYRVLRLNRAVQPCGRLQLVAPTVKPHRLPSSVAAVNTTMTRSMEGSVVVRGCSKADSRMGGVSGHAMVKQ